MKNAWRNGCWSICVLNLSNILSPSKKKRALWEAFLMQIGFSCLNNCDLLIFRGVVLHLSACFSTKTLLPKHTCCLLPQSCSFWPDKEHALNCCSCLSRAWLSLVSHFSWDCYASFESVPQVVVFWWVVFCWVRTTDSKSMTCTWEK